MFFVNQHCTCADSLSLWSRGFLMISSFWRAISSISLLSRAQLVANSQDYHCFTSSLSPMTLLSGSFELRVSLHCKQSSQHLTQESNFAKLPFSICLLKNFLEHNKRGKTAKLVNFFESSPLAIFRPEAPGPISSDHLPIRHFSFISVHHTSNPLVPEFPSGRAAYRLARARWVEGWVCTNPLEE